MAYQEEWVQIEPTDKRLVVKILDQRDWPDGLGQGEESRIVIPDAYVSDDERDFDFCKIIAAGAQSGYAKGERVIIPHHERAMLAGKVFIAASEVLGRYTE